MGFVAGGRPRASRAPRARSNIGGPPPAGARPRLELTDGACSHVFPISAPNLPTWRRSIGGREQHRSPALHVCPDRNAPRGAPSVVSVHPAESIWAIRRVDVFSRLRRTGGRVSDGICRVPRSGPARSGGGPDLPLGCRPATGLSAAVPHGPTSQARTRAGKSRTLFLLLRRTRTSRAGGCTRRCRARQFRRGGRRGQGAS